MSNILKQLREIEMKVISEWLKPRTVFAAMFYGTMCYLILNQLPVPEILKNIITFLMGFYFGQKLPEQKKQEGQDV